MTHKIAGNISFFLCKKGMIEGKELYIYQYGFEVFLDAVLETLMLLVVGMKTAKGTVNKSSLIYAYQIRSPDMLRERMKKKEK